MCYRPRVASGTALYGIVALSLLSSPPAQAAPDPALIWSVALQHDLPALDSRRQTADAQQAARQAFFDGGGSLGQAFPALVGVSLGSEHVLRGRLALLDDAAVDRAQEAAVPLPAGLSSRRRSAWARARTRTLTAEARAAELEQRLIVSLLATLEDHPELSAQRIGARRTMLVRAQERSAQAATTAEGDALLAAQRRAAAADAALATLDQWVLSLRLADATGRAPVLSASIAALEDPDAGPAAADRLRLALPVLPPSESDVARTALLAYYTGPALDAASAALAAPAVVVPVTEAEAALEAHQAELASWVPGTPLADAGHAVAQARVSLAERELEAARAHHSSAEQAAGAASDQMVRAQTEAQQAQEDAEQARASAADARDRLRADALADYAAAQARSAKTWELTQQAEDRLTTEVEVLHDSVADLSRQVDKIFELSTLSRDRPEPDDVYRGLRKALSALRSHRGLTGEHQADAERVAQRTRAAVAQDRQRIAEATGLLDGLQGEDRDQLQVALERWDEVLGGETRAADQLQDTAHQEYDGLLAALTDARVAKRAVSPKISRSLRQQDSRYFLSDLWQEVSLLVPSVLRMGRERIADLVALPLLLLQDWNVARGLLAGSFWSLVSGGIWWWLRRRADSLALQAAERVRRVRPEVRLSDVVALRKPMAGAIRNTVDLLLGTLLLWSLGDALPEVQFLVAVYLYLASYRVLMAVFDLLVVPTTEVRPGLLSLRPATADLARGTMRLFAGYLVAQRFLEFILWDVLALDTLSGIVRALLSVAFWGLVAFTLYRWEPTLRARLGRRSTENNRIVAWLVRDDGGRWLSIPRAAGQVVVFLWLILVELAHRLAREGTSVAWLFNTVSRYGLDDDEAMSHPLAEEDRRRIIEGPTAEKHQVQRTELEEVTAALQRWQQEQRRGLVALVGDRGTGKHTASDQIRLGLESAELPVIVARLPNGLRAPEALFEWLAAAAGLPAAPTSTEAMVEALEALEPSAFVLQNIHHAFARRVGGVDLIQTLFYVLNATSYRHFYLVTVHGPAWDYFAATGSLVDCGVFHTVVRLAPLTSQQLRELTLGRAGQAQLRIDFSALRTQSALGGDPEVERERAVGVFYRLLADASGGSPTTAIDLFSRSLEATDDPHVARAHMGKALSVGFVPGLSDAALFVLVALNLHDELELDELSEVTNLGLANVRATVRDLLSRGLLRSDEAMLRIPDRHRSSIQRTLRRRHFLHLGA